jgi:hypothetical protein
LARSSDGGNDVTLDDCRTDALTRDELCDLAARITHKLPELDAGTVARFNALASLDNIRRVMVLRHLHP